MKSLKKLSAVLLSLVLSFSVMGVPATAFAAVQRDSSVSQAISSDYYALDQEGLLSSSDVKALNQTGKSLKSNYGVGAYFITVSDFGNNADAGAYADAFVEAYGLETANGQRGCLVFVVSKGEREYEVRAYGAAKNTFSDDVIDYLIKELFPYLGRADWSGAAETFFSDAEQTLSGKQANSSSTVPYTQGTYVIDNYGLFSDEQREKLESTAQNFASTYGMGVYLLVVDYMQDSNGKNLSNPSSAQRTNFATSFYRANGLGLNKASEKYGDGIMLVLAVKSRDYVTIAYGQGSYSFNDEGIEYMEEAVKDELRNDNWYRGSTAYYDSIGEQLAYYADKGKPWTEPNYILLFVGLLVAVVVPLVIASTVVNHEEAAMKTAREATEASNFLVPDSLELSVSRDDFIRTTLSQTKRIHESSGGGGGGGGFGGGGGWGGGGGGGFSSSGGGKF